MLMYKQIDDNPKQSNQGVNKMKKIILYAILLVIIVLGVAEESQAGWGGKYVEFVNRSSSPVRIYFHIDYYGASVWHNSYLGYDGVLFPGESATYYVRRGLYAWFKFQDFYGHHNYCKSSCCNVQTSWIDARWSTYDEIVYIY